MTTDAPRSVLLIGRSQLVLDDSVAGLRDLGYKAQATNDFSDVTRRFDVGDIDLVVFGGQVPPERKTELRHEIAAINPPVIVVQGLAGIPGLIIDQVRGAFTGAEQDAARAPRYTPEDRTIRITLPQPADVRATIWWPTSFVPPDPKSDSLVLLDDRLPGGDHALRVPDHVLPETAFASVQVGTAIHAFSLAAGGADPDGHGLLA